MSKKVCAVAACKNKPTLNNKSLSWHRFPKNDEELRNEWIKRCKRDVNINNSRVCSAHFAPEDFERNFKEQLMGIPVRPSLKANAIPTLHLEPDQCFEEPPIPCIKTRKRPSNDENGLSCNSRVKLKRCKIADNSHLKEELVFEVVDSTIDDAERTLKEPSDDGCSKIKPFEPCSTLSIESDNQLESLNDEMPRNEALTPSEPVHKTDDDPDDRDQPQPAKLKHKAHIKSLFTPNQLLSLMKTKEPVQWTDDEIFEAIKLRFFSYSTYTYLRKEKGYPFPGRLAVIRWLKKMKLRGGLLQGVLKMMELGVKHFSNKMDGYCVLSLSEMDVKGAVEYDESDGELIGPYKKMKVMMASSMAGSWKQPVFVDFDAEITEDTVTNVIRELYEVGCHVVCFTSDCSDVSVKLWSDLGVSMNRPCFLHPAGGLVVVIPDALHAIRLVQNHLLDEGLDIEGDTINKQSLDALLQSGVSPQLKLYLQRSLQMDSVARLLSVGAVLTPNEPDAAASSTGNFLKVMNHWFDLMNVGTSELNVPFRSPYGRQRNEQDRLLDHVKSVMSCMNCGGNKAMQPFQIGIIMSCNGLSLLCDQMNKHSEIGIMTKWLNHSTIDDLFSLLRTKTAPTPIMALDKLRLLLFDRNSLPVNTYLLNFVCRQAEITLIDNTYPSHEDEGSDHNI